MRNGPEGFSLEMHKIRASKTEAAKRLEISCYRTVRAVEYRVEEKRELI